MGTVDNNDAKHLQDYLEDRISNIIVCQLAKQSPCAGAGDASGDGKVTDTDRLMAYRYFLDSISYPLTDEQKERADVSSFAADHIYIRNFLEGRIISGVPTTSFSVCSTP